MILGVPKETYPGERRVAIVPAAITALQKTGLDVVVEAGAGVAAGFPDDEYAAKGAKIAASRADVFSSAEIVVQVVESITLPGTLGLAVAAQVVQHRPRVF